jgi:hypothetical protein
VEFGTIGPVPPEERNDASGPDRDDEHSMDSPDTLV